MREIPILFRDELVRAILDGRKTVTRRLAKLHPPYVVMSERDDGAPWPYTMDDGGGYHAVRSPYGAPGDVLWVRECWSVTTGAQPGDLGAAVRYRADGEVKACWMPADRALPLGLTWYPWRPSIHMPRWASRLTLRVTDVRVERLQDITEEDARAEGVEQLASGSWRDYSVTGPDSPRFSTVDAVVSFRTLWNSLAKPGATWADNPWVWRIAFERGESAKGGES